MNKILMWLDYNDTIDNLIPKCAEHESGGRFPTFFRGVLSMAVATKSTVSVAIISSAKVEEIKEEINIINYYANMYCKLAIGESGSLINYIVGNKSKEIYNCNTGVTQPIDAEAQTKKEGVEAVLGLPSEQGTKLVITGGDTKEDLAMINADTSGIPNVFIAPKANKDLIGYDEEALTIRDSRNNNSEGIGRCLITLSRSLEEYNLTDVFSPKSEEDSQIQEDSQLQENNAPEESEYNEVLDTLSQIKPQPEQPTEQPITEIPEVVFENN